MKVFFQWKPEYDIGKQGLNISAPRDTYESVFISKKQFAVHIRLFKSDIKLCTDVIQSLLLVLQLCLFAI